LWGNDRLTRRIDQLLSKLDDADRSTELFGTWADTWWTPTVKAELLQSLTKLADTSNANSGQKLSDL